MPKPKSGESEKDYMSRCMAYPDMQKYESDQRAAICHSMFKEKSQMENLKKGISNALKNLQIVIKKMERQEIYKSVLNEIPSMTLNLFSYSGQMRFKDIYLEKRLAGSSIEDSLNVTSKLIVRSFKDNKLIVLKSIQKELKRLLENKSKFYLEKAEHQEGDKKMIFGKPFTFSGGKWIPDEDGGKEEEKPEEDFTEVEEINEIVNELIDRGYTEEEISNMSKEEIEETLKVEITDDNREQILDAQSDIIREDLEQQAAEILQNDPEEYNNMKELLSDDEPGFEYEPTEEEILMALRDSVMNLSDDKLNEIIEDKTEEEEKPEEPKEEQGQTGWANESGIDREEFLNPEHFDRLNNLNEEQLNSLFEEHGLDPEESLNENIGYLSMIPPDSLEESLNNQEGENLFTPLTDEQEEDAQKRIDNLSFDQKKDLISKLDWTPNEGINKENIEEIIDSIISYEDFKKLNEVLSSLE